MIVFYAAETSDLIVERLPLSDPGQPWVCEIAAEWCDAKLNHRGAIDAPIRAEGRKIKAGAEAHHGISSREAERHGVSEITVLGTLIGFVADSRYVVGHSLNFSRRVIEGVLTRRGKDTRLWTRPGVTFIDVQDVATMACKVPKEGDNGQFKRPTLDQACAILLHEDAPSQPDVREKCARVKRLFVHMLKQGLIEAPEVTP